MGLSFRKGFKFGPLKLNLSKSGIGASVGVKGLRVGTGPKGNYLSAGAKGIYYRQSFSSGKGGNSVNSFSQEEFPFPNEILLVYNTQKKFTFPSWSFLLTIPVLWIWPVMFFVNLTNAGKNQKILEELYLDWLHENEKAELELIEQKKKEVENDKQLAINHLPKHFKNASWGMSEYEVKLSESIAYDNWKRFSNDVIYFNEKFLGYDFRFIWERNGVNREYKSLAEK